MGLVGPREAIKARSAATAIVVVAALLAAPPGWCKQVAFPYADDVRQFSVCVLDPGGIGAPTAAPAVGLLLGQPPPVPGNWQLSDPLGGPVVPTASTIEKLAECDVVVVDGASLESAVAGGAMTPDVQDALLQIADSGALVWIDYDPTAGPWTPNPAPRLAGFAATVAPGPGTPADPSHPLLNEPLKLTPTDIATVGTLGTVTFGDPRVLSPVVSASVWAGEYGSGALVVSACGAMAQIAGGVPGALKLAVNVLEWSNRWTQQGADPRHTGEINLTVEPPLVARWQFPGVFAGPPIPPVVGSAVVARGMVFVCDSGGTLYALDADPPQDLDGDLSADDGLPDYGTGAPYDVVWTAPLPGSPGMTAPCATTVGGAPAVLVTTVGGGVGTLACFNALTGAPLWAYSDGFGAYGGASTVWVSSPVAHKGYGYFIAQDAAGYTRAHAVALDPVGTPAWAYPHAAFEAAPVGPALLPPAVDPAAVAGPTRGPTPIVASLAHVPDGSGTGTSRALDTVMVFGTFGSYTGPHGTQIALVPTPPPADPGGTGILTAPNFDAVTGVPYYAVETTSAAPVDPPDVLQDNLLTFVPGPEMAVLPTAPNAVTFSETWARGYLVDVGAPPAPPPPPRGGTASPSVADPLGWREGRNVIVEVVAPAAARETCFLRGPVLWKYDYPDGEGAGHGATADFEKVIAPTDPQGYAGPGVFGYYHAGEDRSVGLRWAPGLGSPLVFRAMAAAGAENTAYIVGDAGPTAGGTDAFMDMVGLKIDAEMKIRLASPPDTGSVVVTLVSPPGGPISPSAYEVDESSGEITFDPAQVGLLGGLLIAVDYTMGGAPVAGEPHALPDVRRWEHAPGLVKLRYSLPAGNPINVYLADIGSPASAVVGFTSYDNGIVDLSAATCPGVGLASVLGREVEVHYVGWSEADGGPVTVGAPAGVPPGTIRPERHLVPAAMGATYSAPCVTGDAIHAGGFNSGVPLGSPGGFTAHSARWDKPTNAVSGHDAPPALSMPLTAMAVHGAPAGSATPRRPIDVLGNQLSIPLAPDLSAGPAGRAARLYVPPVMDGTVVVGAAAPDGAPTAGYISGLAPPRTMIADATRIVEAKGPYVEWEATGSVGMLPGRSAVQFRPFTRPAKATVLDRERNVWVLTTPGGAPDFRDVCAQSASNILVVDTGNNRVVEIDRDGDMVWPGDPVFGGGPPPVLLYHNELDFGLDSPGDACRWVDAAGPVYHTVIADTGNWRLLHVATTVDPATLGQTHVVTEISPPQALLDPDPMDADPTPTRMSKVGYSQVIPLFDIGTGAPIGYLCAAVNLHQLIVISATGVVNPVGAPFGYVQWLYDRNLDGVKNDPLVFEDIKHVSVYPPPKAPNARGTWPYGGPIYLTVTASRYVNPPPGPFAAAWDGTLERAGCFQFNALAPALGEPVWHFTARDYLYDGGAGPRAISWLTDAAGATTPKQFIPVSCQRLDDGSHVICNAAPQRANVTLPNFPGQDVNLSQVFRAVTDYAAADNAAGLHLLDHRNFIPDPFLRPWNQPLSQPAYAQRY